MIELGFRKIGQGNKTIIFLHELLGDTRNYDLIFPYLNEVDFTYYFVDLRGYGKSKNIHGLYTCEEASSDVLNLIKTLNLKNVNLLAHSMSTLIAQKIAIIAKEYISQLILITPIIAAGLKLSQKSNDKLLNDMKNDPKNIENIVRSASIRYNESWVQYRIKVAQDSSIKEARVGYMNMYLTTDFAQEAKEITIPIKIIVGKNDFVIFSYKTVKRLFDNIYKDVEIYECLEAGHYPMIEVPVYFASKIEEFCK